ncbi:MAG: phosphoglyceromutase [Ignavibacteria bacterium GWF2_33_9]|nr:MAG: phosphoglyceromutase [Ignavibacteria bacterium GWF2_33_9]
MYKIVLIRHGESLWNSENRFTGWTDIDLSERGINESFRAGRTLKNEGFTFDIAFTSVLTRAIRTLNNILDEMNLMWIPVYKSWRLNERHYGEFQGMNKTEMAQKIGEDKVLIYRRSFDIPPPALKPSDSRYPGNDVRYESLDQRSLPFTECLKDTIERVVPYWTDVIVPKVLAGKRVLIAAHGNSLRALIKYLDNVSGEEIVQLNVPTGIPLVYELDENLKPIKHYYVGDPTEIEASINYTKNQGKAK